MQTSNLGPYLCQACAHESRPGARKCLSCGAWGTVAYDPRRGAITRAAERKLEAEERRLEVEAMEAERQARIAALREREGEVGEEEGVDDSLLVQRVSVDGFPAAPLEGSAKPQRLGDVPASEIEWIPSGMEGFDSVTGGGFPLRRALLLSAKYGAGKSTLILQALSEPSKQGFRIRYISSEEQEEQIANRSRRIGTSLDIEVIYESDLRKALIVAEDCDIAVFDSAQMFRDPTVKGAQGDPLQIKNFGTKIKRFVNAHRTSVIVICQETKAGAFAGPTYLAHVLDAHFVLKKFPNGKRAFVCLEKNRQGQAPMKWKCRMDKKGKIVERLPEKPPLEPEIGIGFLPQGGARRKLRKFAPDERKRKSDLR